jgi:signal transduction histidine kinase/DNA-binding NarL/FixJ family response regulator
MNGANNSATTAEASQRIVNVRRDYNNWVANETLEDYALRFTPHSFRKWSIFRVSMTALGAISFLVQEAIGGTLAVNYGFYNAFWAILAVTVIIFLISMPISFYAAKYGLDMDLLTRGAGFGYIGSTISSFVYATFTFILFALEAVIMAYALTLYFDIPLYISYLICSIVVIPLVIHGVTLISRIQMFTQPIWLLMMFGPVIFILFKEPEVLSGLWHFSGISGIENEFNIYMFGSAIAVALALVPQIGEQVDYLRFMPEKTSRNKKAWNLGVISAGPGWIILGMVKLFIGALLAYLAIEAGMTFLDAENPTNMYYTAFSYVSSNPGLVLAATVFFVVLCQIKINITNAYAGSLAWSNFFARLTHSHPGRVVWLVFNVFIATLLMLLNVFQALEQVLGLYSNIAISWITAVVADLVINKPLGLSPKGIEFRRAYLYDINPVGVGAMTLASIFSVTAFLGLYGPEAQSFSSFIAIVTAFVLTPLLALLTKGKFYLARQPHQFHPNASHHVCVVCQREYEVDDVAHCPAYQGSICSLCCTLDARCHDTCKPHATLASQWQELALKLLPKSLSGNLHSGIGHYLLLMFLTIVVLGSILGLVYVHVGLSVTDSSSIILPAIRDGFLKVFFALALISTVIVWWLVLTAQSRKVAQQESNNQNTLLQREITLHKQTDAELQKARVVAEQANEAKSRYITGISHELRTPLNSILGYAQLLNNNDEIKEANRYATEVILRSGDHLLSLIDGTLDIARIESGKLEFEMKSLRLVEYIKQILSMFEIQARNKELGFHYEISKSLPPVVRADHKRLTQILVNVLGNAVKYTNEGRVKVSFDYAREFLDVKVSDTGPGITPEEMDKIFEPFVRGSAAAGVGGSGIGLTICKLLIELMGGDMELTSTPGEGTIFKMRLYLPTVRVDEVVTSVSVKMPIGFVGTRYKILVVDNEPLDRELVVNVLTPLGFEVKEAASGLDCLQQYQTFKPDIIFMDLAMPEMNGWEAIHVIRNVHKSNVHIGIISANAFDRNLDNNSIIPAEDFLVKPLSLLDLINWIGERLRIEWTYEQLTETNNRAANTAYKLPSKERLESLLNLLNIGYMAGVRNLIDEIERKDEANDAFIDKVRKMSEEFKLEDLKRFIENQLKKQLNER